ncbi:MAG: dihydroorotate dehydrogenase [Clostridiales bacterium]|nr:dihydroorotate dehydrogenase [Clostridiales bacterium]
MNNMKINFCGINFKNPIITAAGTFGSGKEFDSLIDLNKLGGITVKGVSSKAWGGNPVPRVAETYGGMLNSVGLQNPGVDAFISEDAPFLKKYNVVKIVNVCGHSIEEYVEVIQKLNHTEVDMYELNISCPNVSEGGIAFGTDTKLVGNVVSAAKKAAQKPLIVKLSPNVTDISEIAKAAEGAGADALSLINTVLGMKIDIKTRKPVLANKTGGLSGPCIKPIAVRMVYEASKAVKVPVIGMGGVLNFEDAVEFMMAGASLVAVGTASFINPLSIVNIIDGVNGYLYENKINDIKNIIGVAE